MIINKLSPDWLMAKAWLLELIEQSRRTMEAGLTSDDYNFERGRIAMARALIEAVEPTSPPVTVEEDYGISETPNESSFV